MAKDELLLRRAAEFRAENEKYNKAFALGGGDLEQRNAALDRAAGNYWEHLALLKRGDADALEPVLSFLETHPRFFRSGYLAEWMIKAILRGPRWEIDSERIMTIALGILDDGPSRELRAAANLASTVWGSHMQQQLGERHATATAASDLSTVRRIEFFREQASARYNTFHAAQRPDRPAGQSHERRLRRWREVRRRKVVKALSSTSLAEDGMSDTSPEFMSTASAAAIARRVVTRLEEGILPPELAAAMENDVAQLHGSVNRRDWSFIVLSLSEEFCANAASSRPPVG